ncbi:DivIVA domain-containing protein [Streptomyces sp. NPDC059010]|uniref:DivIVA domain-containing protein n=1 Tax=Streptomyces sp. NPDC059010 TaxID=3346695 RepID=UPI0036A4CE0F
MGDACCEDTPDTEAVPSSDTERHPDVPGRQRPLLTSDDVHHQLFPTVRLREGYELGAVDSFLHVVERTIDRLHKDNAALRAELAAAQYGQRPSPPASEAAARVLLLTDQTARQAIEGAQAECARLLGDARAQARRTEEEARLRADRIERAAALQSTELDRRARDQHTELEQLRSSGAVLRQQLGELRDLLAECRRRLAGDLDSRLDDIERRAEQFLVPRQAPPAAPDEPLVPAWRPAQHDAPSTAGQALDRYRDAG